MLRVRIMAVRGYTGEAMTLTGTLAAATEGVAYSSGLTAVDSVGAVAWTISVGTLPAGLTINGSTGLVTGTPTVLGTSAFTVRGVDSIGQVATSAQSIVVSAVTLYSEIMADTPWAYYQLGETAGATSYADSSGNGRNLSDIVATVTAGSTQVVPPGTSVDFDGVSGRISSTNNQYGADTATALDGSDKPFTLMAAFNADAHGGVLMHIGNYSAAGSQGIFINTRTDGSARLSVNLGTGTLNADSPINSIVLGQNYILHGVFESSGGATGVGRIYLNGAELGNSISGIGNSVQCAATTSSGGNRIMLGALNHATPDAWRNGRIQHAAVFTQALSAARILAHAQAAGLA